MDSVLYLFIFVTGFTKPIPNGTKTEIQFKANINDTERHFSMVVG